MKLGDVIERIKYLETKDSLLQDLVRKVEPSYGPELVAEVQSDIDRLLRAPVLEELEELKGKEVRDGRRRTPKSEG